MHPDRIKHIFDFMEWDHLTGRQLELIISLEGQWKSKRTLSDPQVEMLEDIFKKASEGPNWSSHEPKSRWEKENG